MVLTIYGLALGVVPAVPAPDLPPELIQPLVLPPLLFAATQATSVSELRFAVGLSREVASRKGEDGESSLREVLLKASEVERDVVVEARRTGAVSPAAADCALLQIETRSL